MRKSFLPKTLLCLVLAACAEPAVVVKWAKPGATGAEFVSERAACVEFADKQAKPFYLAGARDPAYRSGMAELVADVEADFHVRDQALVSFDAELFRRCMNGHGWHVDPKGFASPEGDEVAMGY